MEIVMLSRGVWLVDRGCTSDNVERGELDGLGTGLFAKAQNVSEEPLVKSATNGHILELVQDGTSSRKLQP